MPTSRAPQSPATFRLLLGAWPWAAAACSGGLATLCFAPWNQSWLCWFALTPLIAAVWSAPAASWFGRPWVRGLALGYVAGLVFFWTVFYWIWQVTGPGWFLLGLYMAFYFGAWGAFLASVARPRGGARPAAAGAKPLHTWRPPETAVDSRFLWSRWNLWSAFLAACAWVGLEWMRGWMLSGFGWNDLGAGLHAILPLIQIAQWTGVGGLSFLAAFANVIAVATVWRFAAEIRLHRIRPHFDFTLTIACVLVVFAFGVRTLQTSQRGEVFKRLHVAAVQPNISLAEIWDASSQEAVFKTLRNLSGAAAATRPQLILWPESATPRGIFGDRDNFQFVMDVAKNADCNFLLGTLDYDFGEDGRSAADYNAAVLLPRNGGDAQVYRKIHLVPFGEYVPFRHSFPPLAWIVGDQVPGDFAAGNTPGVLTMADPAVRLGPLICFEDTIGRLARQPVLRGAQLLVNVTNDAWFGRTGASEQQFDEAVFRTVENRRPLVRCANTGLTGFIDQDGRVTQVLRFPDGTGFGAGVLSGEVNVPVNPPLTFYTLHGEVFSIGCAEAAALAALFGFWGRMRQWELRRRARTRLPSPPVDQLQPAP